MSAGIVQELQVHALTYHLKVANNHNTFLSLTLIFSQFKGNSVIV